MEETIFSYVKGELESISIYTDLIGESWWMSYKNYPVE